MKKKIAITVAALLLLTGTAAYGATSSIVGAKVQGIFSVVVNGEKISDAVVVNGLTYVPLRSISNSIGGDIQVVGKTVSIVTPDQSVDVGADERSIILKGKIYGLETTISTRQKKITSIKDEITSLELAIAGNEASPVYADRGIVFRDTELYKETASRITALQAQVDAINAEITDLQAQIAAVETELAQ